MISNLENPWACGFEEAHEPAKDQTVAQWCAENVYLANSPIAAKYQPGGFQDDILNDLQDPDVYESAVVGHTGMGKSVILECASCWIVDQAPGPTLVLGQTKDTVKAWADTRLMKAFAKCEAVAKRFPTGKNRHDKRKTSILFPAMEYYIGPANLTQTQEVSMRYTLGDEAWAWVHGIIGELLKRHHDRWNRKNLLVAQGGIEDDDWHVHTRDGLGFDRGFNCPACGAAQKFQWGQVKYETELDGNDEFDWPKIFRSVHYQCQNEHCGEVFPDNPRGRQRLNSKALYICRHNSHIPGRITRYIPAMANPRIQLGTLVKEWLLAEQAWKNGDRTPRRQFIQKRLADFWVEKIETPSLRTGGERYSIAEFHNGEKWEGEFDRHFRIDVQKGHFWASVRALKLSPTGLQSRLLWAGKVDTWQSLFELQDRFGVENRRVFIDGRYNIDEIVRQIYLHCGEDINNHWTILIGQENDKGYQFDVGTAKRPRRVWRIYSKYQYGNTHRGQRFRTVSFSNLRAKDALVSLMELEDGSFGIPFDAPAHYVKHMQAETKREINPGKWRWEKVKDHYRNDLWDTEVMGIVAATICGAMRLDMIDD